MSRAADAASRPRSVLSMRRCRHSSKKSNGSCSKSSTMALDPLAPYHNRLQALTPFRVSGTVTDVVGLLITSRGPWLPVGAVCKVYPLHSENPALAEVVGFRGEQTLLMPL